MGKRKKVEPGALDKKEKNAKNSKEFISKEKEEEVIEKEIQEDMEQEDKEPGQMLIKESDKALTEEENLKGELEEAKALAAQHWESFLRARADYENLKKRSENQISSSVVMGKKIIVGKVLNVLDNFERAMNVDDSKVNARDILIGVRMIYKQLSGVLEDEGLKQIPTVGNIFDPRLHEAIDSIISADYKDEEIIQEFVKGYTFKDEIIRPAQVKVSRISA